MALFVLIKLEINNERKKIYWSANRYKIVELEKVRNNVNK
jgi:hypothetical protein